MKDIDKLTLCLRAFKSDHVDFDYTISFILKVYSDSRRFNWHSFSLGMMVTLLIMIFSHYTKAQQKDTTSNYSIARSKVDKLIRIALKAKECDTLVQKQEKLINDDIRGQAKADSVIKAEREHSKTLRDQVLQCDTLSTDRLELLGIEHRQKKKWKGIAIFMGLAEAVKIALTGKL